MPVEPLVFCLHQGDHGEPLDILLHVVDDDDDDDNDEEEDQDDVGESHDTGFVLWPAAVVLARWLGMHPALLQTSAAQGNVLELGAGCGLVGLAAATLIDQERLGAPPQHHLEDDNSPAMGHVIFSDYNPTVLKNLERNIVLNHLGHCTQVTSLDFMEQKVDEDDQADHKHSDSGTAPSTTQKWVDMDGNFQSQVQLILGAEILAYSNDAVNVATTILVALKEGGTAIVVSPDESLRFGVEEFPDACRNVGLQVEVLDNLLDMVSFNRLSSSGEDSETDQLRLVQDLQKTIGFNKQGYAYSNLKMFVIEKALSLVE